MKRFLSILLIFCVVMSLLPMTFASAASDLTEVEKAIVETALAYYYKGNAVQYDSYYIGNGGRFTSAILRQTNDKTPEESSPDDIHYTVCSAYPWDVYLNTFDDRVIGQQERIDLTPLADHKFATLLSKMEYTEEQLAYEYSIECIGRNYSFLSGSLLGKDDRAVAYFGPSAWDANGNVTALSSIGQSADDLEKLMRPGDIITVRPYKIVTDTDGTGDESDDETTDEIVDGTGSGTEGGTGHYVANGGHTMMYLGDVFGDGVTYVIHSWGSKYDNSGTVGQVGPDGTVIRGFDYLESAYSWKGTGSGNYVGRNGSIVLTPYSKILGPGKSYDVAKSYDYSILRPAANKTLADLSASARFRLDRPGITITKTASVKPYRDVIVSDEITYTVKIENNTKDTVNSDVIAKGYGAVLPANRSKTYKDLVLTETLPENVCFSYGSGNYHTSGNDIIWQLPTLAPGEAVTVSYTVEVSGGKQVVSPEGKLTATGASGFLPTKTLIHEISPQELPKAKISTIEASSVSASSTAKRSGTDVAEDVYAAMGYSVDIPDGQELADLLLREVPFPTDSASRHKTDFQLAEPEALTGEAKTLRNMIVPGFVGGARLFTADENQVRTNRTRLLQISEDYLEPGDVLVYLNSGRSNGTYLRNTKIQKTDAYVYLGSSNWAHYVDGEFTITNAPIKMYYGTSSAVTEMPSDYGSNICGAKSGSKKFTYSEILHQCFLQDVFFLMRPARVGLTSMTATSAAKAVEVKAASGSTWYADLKTAVAKAADNSTIILHEDIEVSTRQIISNNMTMDLNGHSISCSGADDTLLVNDTAVVTMKNGTVHGTIYASSSAQLALENMNLMGWGTPHGSGYVRYGCALLTTGNAKVTLRGVSIASEYASKAPIQRADNWTNYANITVLDDVKIMVPKGVTWDYSTMVLGENVKAYVGQGRSLDGKTKSDAYTCLTLTASPDVHNETTDVYYASLSEALRLVNTGDTLRLLRDIDTHDYDEVGQNYDSTTGSTKYMFYCNKTVTLEMDGHTIADKVSANGTFMLRDDGKTANGISTFTMKNGKVYSDVMALSGGQMVLENLEIRSDRTGVYHVSTGADGQTSVVKNCTVISGFGGRDGSAAVSCSKGTITVRNSVILSNDHQTVVVGTGEAKLAGTVTLENTKVLSHMYVYNAVGNTLKGVHADNHIGPAEGNGLTASMEKITYIIDGKAMPFLMDTYSVTDPVATVNGVGYASLKGALEDLQSGETAVLAANAILTEDVTVPEGATLEVGSKKLTMEESAVMTVAGTVTAENGEIIAAPEQVKLEGKGNYLGITIPKGTEGTVYADPALDAGYTFTVGATLEITGTVNAEYDAMVLISAEDSSVLTENIQKDFVLGNLSAKEMDEEQSVVLTAVSEDCTYVGPTETICLKDCAQALLDATNWDKETSAAAGRALVAMLNYGAAAQTYFGYRTDDLANKDAEKYTGYLDAVITEYVLSQNRQENSSAVGSNVAGASCVLGEDLRLKVYFRVPKGSAAYTFRVTYGNTVLDNIKVSDLTKVESNSTADIYSLKLENMTLKDYAETVSISVFEDTKMVSKAKDSIQSYLARLYASGKTELADAILTYAIAVKELS